MRRYEWKESGEFARFVDPEWQRTGFQSRTLQAAGE
jgi:hypothetical protein